MMMGFLRGFSDTFLYVVRNPNMRHVLLISVILISCNSGPRKVISAHASMDTVSELSFRRDTSTIDIHDPYETGRDTVRLNAVMDKILKFPEVEVINKQINKTSKGSHGVSIMVRDEFDDDTAYYSFMVGDNSHEDRYVNIFNFLMEKKTGQIRVYDAEADSIMSLKEWRKTKK
jgi:hypothetical protein